jgi:hypothetical protein
MRWTCGRPVRAIASSTGRPANGSAAVDLACTWPEHIRGCAPGGARRSPGTDRRWNQYLPCRTVADRRCRFDLREGHDLERLIWPRTGSGVSTGLLQNSPSMPGRLRRSIPFDRRRRSSSSNADHRTCFDQMIVRRRCWCRPQRPHPPSSYEEKRPHRRCDGA